MQINVVFHSSFLCNSLLKEKQKNSIVRVLSNFCIHYNLFLEKFMKRKPMKQKHLIDIPTNL